MLNKYDKFAERQCWNEMTDENCMDFLIYERLKKLLLVQTRAFFDKDSNSTTFLSVINGEFYKLNFKKLVTKRKRVDL